MKLRSKRSTRRGAIVVLAAFMMVFLMAVMAFAVDLGYVLNARAELQRTADSAALSSAWELINEGEFGNDPSQSQAIHDLRNTAANYAAMNSVLRSAPAVDTNFCNDSDGDVVVGHLADLYDPDVPMSFHDFSDFNAVRVRIRRTANMNGGVPLLFARVLGWHELEMQAEATAAAWKRIGGVRTPAEGGSLEMLPFALDEETWEDLMDEETHDHWTWHAQSKSITPGGDGIWEANLYPQGTGSPGNRGTVDIGSYNNSTTDIARQILDGVSPADLDYHGGELKFDDSGELDLNGDTGISAGVKDELNSIKGEPRIIPIFRRVNSPGNNAQFTIVKLVGVRILDVKLTGRMSSKRVIIQPAPIVTTGGIPSTTEGSSDLVFTPVHLVR